MFSSGTLRAGGIEIALDDDSAEHCFVSHAHSDHTSAFFKARKIIASEETFTLMGKRHAPPPTGAVRLHHAGHMLGARQISAETGAGKFAYTGDFSLEDSYTAKKAEIIGCDTLMVDSTYCQPRLCFPSRFEVFESMAKFMRQNAEGIVVFGAYSTGKAQELCCFLNRECGIAPVLSGKAAEVSERYQKCGVRMDFLKAGTPEAEEAMKGAFTAILPPQQVDFSFGAKLSEAHSRSVKTAVATGWAALSRFPVDAAFPLSDHADFRATMAYIEGSGAKTVICANSGASPAASYLKRSGINAITKDEMSEGYQTVLA